MQKNSNNNKNYKDVNNFNSRGTSSLEVHNCLDSFTIQSNKTDQEINFLGTSSLVVIKILLRHSSPQ